MKNRWKYIVPLLLAAHVSLMSWAVMKATTDHNGTVIPNYYQKAIHWDADPTHHAPATQPALKVEVKGVELD